MIVLDCSAAVEMALATEKGRELAASIDPQEKTASSTLLYFEIDSVFRKYVKAGILNTHEALDRIDVVLDLVDAFYDPIGYYREAFAESIRLDHSPYDLFYCLIAKRNAAPLATCDQALCRLCKAEGVETISC